MGPNEKSSNVLINLLSSIAKELSFCGEDFSSSIDKVLKEVGETLDVSRVYIFEDSEDGVLMSNTYEWCANGVESQINNLQDIPYKELPSFSKALKSEGVFLANDVSELDDPIRKELEPQKIKSILIYNLVFDDKKIGFIGLDETRNVKEWNNEEINILETISFLISNTFARHFARIKMEDRLEEIQKMNDIMVARELKMVGLKEEIKVLKKSK